MMPLLTMAKVSIPFASLMLVWLLSMTEMHQWLDSWILDRQKNIVANEHYFEDSVVLDIDDNSLKRLEPQFGRWPYQRDAYAVMLNYLAQMGAKRVVFDILFAEAREQDAVFREAIEQHNNAVFVAGAPSSEMRLNEQEKSRLTALSWHAEGAVPSVELNAIVLPDLAVIGTGDNQQRIGVISASSDLDGILRRLPMLYKINDALLPSLPLRIVSFDAEKPEVRFDPTSNRLSVGSQHWPVDDKGRLHLYFPNNANSILSLPFYKVAEAALGITTVPDADTFFNNKTVYIGSTAYLSDRVNTPRGAMSGTYLLAIAQETMKHGLVFRAGHIGWNGLLIFIALIPTLILLLKPELSLKQRVLAPVLALSILFLVNLGLLSQLQQQSQSLLALELIVISTLLSFMYYQYVEKIHNLDLIQRNQELNLVANTDTLTELYNRRAFSSAFYQEMQRVNRQGIGLPAIAIMDLDHFKHVNDTYGHDVGDEVLKRFSQVIQHAVRSIDVPGRWGGEEFVVLLPDSTTEEALHVLERIRLAISQTEIITPNDRFFVTVSIGLSALSNSEIKLEDAVKLADDALYQAKKTGRNQVCINR